MTAAQAHTSVMRDDVLAALAPMKDEIYIDGTFGAGGYTSAFLDAADCKVIAIDRDAEAEKRAITLKAVYGDRLIFCRGAFSAAEALVRNAGYEHVDGFVLDLGVSSMQLDQAERGFSFRFDGPLDMRMDTRDGNPDAADLVNNSKEDELADIIYHYGEERHARRVARAIVEARAEKPITRTSELADIVRRVVPSSKKEKIDPATRTFQALRITVNRELEELQKALVAAEHILSAGGRLIIVSFHSLEDGIVKRFLKERAGRQGSPSRHLPDSDSNPAPTFALPSAKAVAPSAAESAANPRSRSAKMRVAIRTHAPAWPVSSEYRRGSRG
jgi:16S rRNA (cytosine1402-N4)-methyltransferase